MDKWLKLSSFTVYKDQGRTLEKRISYTKNKTMARKCAENFKWNI